MNVTVRDHDGDTHQLSVDRPISLMEVIRDHLPIAAECGGNCACATCHVYVDAAWIERLPARQTGEEEMLELAVDPQSNSRLSCQILLTPELDGLSVCLAPGSER